MDFPEPETPVIAMSVPSGKADGDVLQVVLCAPREDDALPVSRRSLFRRSMASVPERYCPVRERGLAQTSSSVPAATTWPPCTPAPGPEVHDVVGGAQRLLVVLDHDEGVADVAQVLQRIDEKRVVALVQPDGRLIEDVEHPDQGRADLGGKP